MAVGMTLSTTLDNVVPLMIAEARTTLQHGNVMRAKMHKENLPDNYGSTAHFPTLGAVVAQTLTEGVDMNNPQQLSDTDFTISPGEEGLQIIVTDKVAKRLQKGILANIGTIASNALNKLEEQNLLALLDGFATSLPGAGTTITKGHISAARTRVQNGQSSGEPAPGDSPIHCVLHNYQVHALLKEFTSISSTVAPSSGIPTYPIPNGMTQDMIRTWDLGNVAGTPISGSGLLTVDGSDDAKGGLFSEMALWYLTNGNDLNQEDERDASLRATEMNWTRDYGYGEWKDAWGIELYADASTPTS